MRPWLQTVLDFALPPVCLGCRGLDPSGALDLGLCPECLDELSPSGRELCSGCGRDLQVAAPPPGYLCGGCRRDPPPWSVLLCGWRYQPPFDRVVRGLKFGRLDYLGGHLARHLNRRFGPELGSIDIVTPVPLHWRRRISRGYNQAEEIARPLARRLGRPCRRLVRRTRATSPQTKLGLRRRAGNLQGAMRPAANRLRSNPAAGAHVLLIDDVVTTGATLRTAARCLLDMGVSNVTALTAGRTLQDRR